MGSGVSVLDLRLECVGESKLCDFTRMREEGPALGFNNIRQVEKKDISGGG